MAYITPPNFTAGSVLTDTELDILSGDIAHVASMRIGATPLSSLSAAYILGGAGFNANDTTNQVVSGLAKLTFTQERFDTNGAYDTSLSRFTAPAGGLYLVGAHLRLVGGGGTPTVSFRKNGVSVYDYGGGLSSWANASITTAVQLAANDFLELWMDASTSTTVQKTSTISEFWGVKVG